MFEACYPDIPWAQWRANWPLSEHSQWVQTPNQRWHVQRLGQGPLAVLLHGTGATTHTWRESAPLLARDHDVLCVDLPGHGFSSGLQGRAPTPANVSWELNALLHTLGLTPSVLVGHSAGALVAAHWWLSHGIQTQGAAPPSLVVINPAWQALPGPSQWLFPLGAWLIDKNPLSGWMLAQRARQPQVVERLLAQTGSHLTPQAVDIYRRMLSEPRHVRGVLQLMCAWDLHCVEDRLAQLTLPVQLHVGMRDATVPPHLAREAAAQMPKANLVTWPELGHLLHEERPEDFVDSVRAWLGETSQ